MHPCYLHFTCLWTKTNSCKFNLPRCNSQTMAARPELICNGCRSLVTKKHSATSIQCSCCICLNYKRLCKNHFFNCLPLRSCVGVWCCVGSYAGCPRGPPWLLGRSRSVDHRHWHPKVKILNWLLPCYPLCHDSLCGLYLGYALVVLVSMSIVSRFVIQQNVLFVSGFLWPDAFPVPCVMMF